jgi:hypothetical protein
MKFFSVFSIIIATLLIGYFIIIGLPQLAKIGGENNSVVENMKHTGNVGKEDLILRDKCNTYLASAIFASGVEADAFLDRCMSGQETSKINVIKSENLTPVATTTDTEPRLTADELSVKCKEFMTHARFESQKDADLFLKNCLAGN